MKHCKCKRSTPGTVSKWQNVRKRQERSFQISEKWPCCHLDSWLQYTWTQRSLISVLSPMVCCMFFQQYYETDTIILQYLNAKKSYRKLITNKFTEFEEQAHASLISSLFFKNHCRVSGDSLNFYTQKLYQICWSFLITVLI